MRAGQGGESRLVEDRIGADVFGLGLEIAQQPMAQCGHHAVGDVVVADADAAVEQGVDFRAQD